MKSWLEKNDIEMYSVHNGGESVVTERFIRTLKKNIYKRMTSLSKNVYTNKLDNIVYKYKHTNHSTMKMKPIDIKSSTYIDFDKKNSKEDPEFKVCDYVRLSKCKSIFRKCYAPTWSDKDIVRY